MEKVEFISKSPSDTWDIGAHLGRHAQKGDVFLLFGELGAGKTQLVKGIARGLGVEDWEYVLSPSFTIMNIYEGRIDLCHVDLYRIEGNDVELLDLEEFIERGVTVVEWAERGSWQGNEITVSIEVIDEETRTIVLEVENAGRAKIWRNFSQGS